MEMQKRILFVFAHQDDEMFITGKIQQELKKMSDVYLVWVTNGNRNGNPEIRKRESIVAMQSLGVQNMDFLEIGEDEIVTEEGLCMAFNKLKTLIEKINPREIYSVGWEGAHIGHDLTNFITFHSVKSLNLEIDLYEYPLNPIKSAFKYVPKFIVDNAKKRILGIYIRDLILLFTISIARFVSKGADIHVSLTRDELKKKYSLPRFYPSQRNVLTGLKIVYPKIKAKKEVYRKIDLNRDYLKSPSEVIFYEIAPKMGFITSGEDFSVYKRLVSDLINNG
ncbi:MAG: PIG-L family deacetylase [Deltaproteobacteria bacterium]|nr:PIG-L family deacetylase [Deltaproteobacteria bacterium]